MDNDQTLYQAVSSFLQELHRPTNDDSDDDKRLEDALRNLEDVYKKYKSYRDTE